jgi:gliding motility-associated-like protein
MTFTFKAFYLSIVFSCMLTASRAQICATPGQDGPTNISTSINTYYPPAGAITLPAGSKSISLSGVPATDPYGNNFGTAQINAGDLLLIIQMQDADINFSNSTLYGSNTSTSGPDGLGATGSTGIGSSGKFEYLIATNNVPLTGGTLTFKGAGTGNGTVNTYINADPTPISGKRSFQLIRITQYSNLRLSSNISPPPYNGVAGGIIAFDVSGTMDFNGYTIDVSARGFRGGYSLIKPAITNINNLYVTTASDSRASGKGEGIAGTPRYMWDGYNAIDNIIEGLPGGSDGRGAPANAGGGGNDTNSGGGGGGNGGFGGVGGWGYEPEGGTFPNGGRPGSTIYPIAQPVDITRLLMGGGGGGGHANDALTGVKGGVGGGIVLINAATIIGNGTILANGGNGAPGVFGGNPDGSGGGGAGGTVFVKVSNPDPTATVNIQSNGGAGGNTEGDPGSPGVQSHGPGGGAGGGIVLYSIATGTVNISVAPGQSGKTNSGAGITHNAAAGSTGIKQIFIPSVLPAYLQGQGSSCYPSLTTTMVAVNPAVAKLAGSTTTYTIIINNTGSGGNAGGAEADCLLPSGFSFQSANAVYTGAASGPAILNNLGTANRPLLGDFNISPGDVVTITMIAKIDCSVPSGTYNSSVQAIYLDPTRTYVNPTRHITAVINALSASNTTYQSNASTNVPGSNYDGGTSTNEDAVVTGLNVISNNNIAQPNPDNVFCAGSVDPSIIVGSDPTGGNGTYTYQWQSSTDNIIFADISGATTRDYDPSAINASTYYRRTVVSGVCLTPSISNVINIQIQPALSANVITAPAAASFCISGNPGIISGNIPAGGNSTYTYQWQNSADGINFTNITGATAKDYDPPVINATTYYQRLTTSGICSTPLSSNIISIQILAALANNTITAPAITHFCTAGDPANINGNTPTGGNGSYTYQWQSSTDGVTFADIPGATVVNYDPPIISATTWYRRTVISNACTVPLNSNVIVMIKDAMPVANAGSDATICVGSSTVLAASGGTVYQWSPATGLSNANTANPTASPTVTTTYTVTVSNITCSTTASVTVNVIQKPTADAGSDQKILKGQTARLNGAVTGNNVQYHWSPASYLDNPNSLNPVATPPEDITYTLTATSANGCFIVSDDVFIKVFPQVIVPNTFTPNADGINDTWDIPALSAYPNSVVLVFNRYGISVFKSIGYLKTWTGEYNGKQVPSGTYYYTIDLKDGSKIISGWVAVIR